MSNLAKDIPSIVVRSNPVVKILNIDFSSFIPSAVGLWRFNKSIEDDIGQSNFSISSGSVKYKEFEKFELLTNSIETRSGLEFETGKIYSTTTTFAYAADFTLSFWYFSPGLVGFTRHFITRELEPKVAPIIAKGNSSSTSTKTILSNSSFIITEIGYSKEKNAIRVYIPQNGSDISHIITSEPFSPGLHHILATYIKSQGRFRIDIDGKPGILHPAPVNSLDKPGLLRINDISPGYIAHKTEQIGAYLFDFVFTTNSSLNNESLIVFRYGYEHLIFSNLANSRFAYFGLSYEQPTTVSTTHIFIDGGSIFTARSNGKIMRGDRPIWDKEFSYPDSDSVKFLTVSKTDDNKTITWTPEGIKLKGVTVKI